MIQKAFEERYSEAWSAAAQSRSILDMQGTVTYACVEKK